MIGLRSLRIHTHLEEAKCAGVIYDPTKFKGICVVDENTEVPDIKPGDHEYFHPDFHSSLNMGIHYIAKEYGMDALKEYLELYTKHVYVKTIAAMKDDALTAIADRIA